MRASRRPSRFRSGSTRCAPRSRPLLALRARASSTCSSRAKVAAFAGLKAEDFVHVLLARYDPGAGIGWHRDRDVFDQVVGVSLGSPAVLRFRQRTPSGFRRTSLQVEPRSAYLLSGEARCDWEHSIAPGDQLRFSITFRTLSSKGHRIAADEA